MPPAGKAISTGSIVFPRMVAHSHQSGKGSYKHFLDAIIRIRGNRAAFAVAKKADVDAEFERQLADILPDKTATQTFMRENVDQQEIMPLANNTESHAQVRAARAESLFAQLQARWSDHTKAIAVTHGLQALDLPPIFKHPRNGKSDVYDRQTYSEFAYKAEKKNPNFAFCKETMDEAFQLAVSRIASVLGRFKARPAQFERMLARVGASFRWCSGYSANSIPVPGQRIDPVLEESQILSYHAVSSIAISTVFLVSERGSAHGKDKNRAQRDSILLVLQIP